MLKDEGRSARQKTLKRAVRCRGVGLHSGAVVTMTLHPAELNSGVQFRCGDQVIRADWRNVAPSPLCTTLVAGSVSIATVEHLLAAFAGLELDNVLVELSGPEVPAMDGSAAPFVELVERAGLVEQRAPRAARSR